MTTKPLTPAAGEIWMTEQGAYVLVAGADRTHAVTCPVAILPDGSVVAHPRGRKAGQVLLASFSSGPYRYVSVAKARTAVTR
ncbi:hypothetical protein AB0M92_18745 [Streptomyces sp. NPDC051582]|uniref:hypothetical protein n=1 Tax=Streptomyces sp. NPDC051582 TaxID=3155167 RepID=UPI00343D3BC0